LSFSLVRFFDPQGLGPHVMHRRAHASMIAHAIV
jgi:hypothetical protein